MLPTRRLALAASFWFASATEWTVVGIVLFPHQIREAVGEANKGRALGLAFALGSLVALVAAPSMGFWSDRRRSAGGRRAPFVLAAAIGSAIVLAVAAASSRTPRFGSLLALIVALQLVHNLGASPLGAWIPDEVPSVQRGRAAGWVSVMRMLGMIAGGALGVAFGALGTRGGYAIAAVTYVVIAPLAWAGSAARLASPDAIDIERTEVPARPLRRALLEPFRDSAFRAIFAMRFVAMMGLFSVQAFLLYFLRDAVPSFRVAGVTLARTAESAAGLFVTVMVVMAVCAASIAGRIRRQTRVVAASLVAQGLAAIVLLFWNEFAVVLATAVLFGAGFGAFQTGTLALASDALPDVNHHGRDMGIWGASLVLPQMFAAPLAGLLLDACNRWGARHGAPVVGYRVLFVGATLCFVVAIGLVTRVGGRRR